MSMTDDRYIILYLHGAHASSLDLDAFAATRYHRLVHHIGNRNIHDNLASLLAIYIRSN